MLSEIEAKSYRQPAGKIVIAGWEKEDTSFSIAAYT